MGALLMVPVTVLVGVLGYMVLRRYLIFAWWSVGIIGAILGVGAAFVFRVLPISSTVSFGAATALLAWAAITGANNSIQRTRCARR